MGKEEKNNLPCICMCLCVSMFLICCLTSKVLNLDWNQCSRIISITLIIVFIICTFMLISFWCFIKKYLSEIKNLQKQITESYKNLKESSILLKNSSDLNDSIYKTIDKVAETFCNKNCDSTKLGTFKEVIEAIIKSYESDRKILSNSEQSQEEKNNGTDSNDGSITR